MLQVRPAALNKSTNGAAAIGQSSMPRIRTVKPEICTSEQVAECSTNARLLFVLMWCFCDDAGRHPASVKRLKMECFPADSFTASDMQALVNELLAQSLLVEYEHESERFWQVTGWKHQRIDRPNYKYGPLNKDGNPAPISTDSTSSRRVVDEPSTSDHPRKGREGKGKEGKGREGSGIDETSTPTAHKQSSVQRNPPSVTEVRQYMADQRYPDDADAFVDFYATNGWVQGRGKPIKDWKAAVRNWQRNDFGQRRSQSSSHKPPPRVDDEIRRRQQEIAEKRRAQ